MRNLWREGATGAVLEFLEDTSGRWLSAGGMRARRVEDVGEGEMSEGEVGDPGPPRDIRTMGVKDYLWSNGMYEKLYWPVFFCSLLCLSSLLLLFWRGGVKGQE